MIKFFRNIRKTLIEQNKMGKYLKYAIGEILLVVIGILIALQVNNWNESRKERLAEQKILKEILIDLEFSKEDLIRDIDINKENLKSAEKLKQILLDRKNIGDSIIYLMNDSYYATQFYPRTTGYQSLKSKGLDLITNDSLRKSIIGLFDFAFELVVKEGREYDARDNSEVDLDNYLKHHLVIDPDNMLDLNTNNETFQYSTHSVKVRNFEALFNDDRFLTMLNKSIIGRVDKTVRYINTLNVTEQVLKDITKELEAL